MGARALVSARWWGGTWEARPPYVAPAGEPIEWQPLAAGVDFGVTMEEVRAKALRQLLGLGAVPKELLDGTPLSGPTAFSTNETAGPREGTGRLEPPSPGRPQLEARARPRGERARVRKRF